MGASVTQPSVAQAADDTVRVPEDEGVRVDTPVASSEESAAATDAAASGEPRADAAPVASADSADAAAADRGRAPSPELDDELEGQDPEGSPSKPPREGDVVAGPTEPLGPDEKRALPDYDGRAAPPTDASDVVRAVPRALLFPAYLVLEYGIRIPTVWTITKVEENKIAERIRNFLSWDEGRASIYPMIYLDFGVRPNLGLAMNWRSFAPRHDVSAGAFVGPGDLWAGDFRLDQRIFRDDEARVRWSLGYVRRPDNVFFGIDDPTTRCGAARGEGDASERGCRYRSAIAEGRLALVGWERRLNQVNVGVLFRHARFSTESDAVRLLPEETAALEAFESGYELFQPHFSFAADTRPENVDFTRGTGLRFEGSGSFNVDAGTPARRWIRGGGELAGFWDIGFGQILGASLYYEAVGNLSGSGPDGEQLGIPFHELVALGGSEQMKSFLRRRLLGSNAWTANVEYRYPITWLLDAAIYTSLGNAIEDLDEFDVARAYLNYGLALKTSGDRAASFEAIVGWGSNRIDEPEFIPFDQFRLTMGFNKGF